MHELGFHSAVERWFGRAFTAPTLVQQRAWRAIGSGRHALISAPTGSGKTLAGFLAVIDALVKQAMSRDLPDETQVLYVSPLKALSNDIQKNLQEPLGGIRCELLELGLPDAPIRAVVRTGDTPQSERARMRKRPPHILVTTPESLYILLTSDSGRRMLQTVQSVIVDEIHAVAGNKRGAHLALSLERLAALTVAPPARVGISATTRPIERMAEFLTGGPACDIIDEGHVRERDLALELTDSPLEAIMSNEVWSEIYDRLAALIAAHRTTLVFVNTRRLAERAARHLAERLGEDAVTSHHGSLAKEHRLNAETRLKAGQLKALVATASLELGIDIGDVDLVCQLGSPHAIAAFLQRVGRSGHGLRRLPKGRLFPLSRDELVECAALLAAVREGELDAVRPTDGALDVLAQQIVAEVGMRDWTSDALYELIRGARPYRDLDRARFDALIGMLADGFSTERGRRSAYLHYDRVNGVLRGRRSARLTAITNGGAIPDQFDYEVVLLPSELPVGTVNEDFAIESLPGNIFQLGNTSYRILKVRTGKVYVEDARGQPPNIPFWFGEAPGRSDELSASVSALRTRLDTDQAERLIGELSDELGLGESAARQLIDYLAAARAALGTLPSSQRIVFERFFDEAGDTHLVIHSPFGSRINRAWGLALRKRFCRRFNFELQAAALEDSIVLSLGAVHSFALEEVASYLHSKSVRHVLEQAVLGAPIFPTYWRYNATIALALKRFRNGKRTPPQFQRTDAEDLLATVFPDQLACAENLPGGDIEIPDHPLVRQTLFDCLEMVMDIAGLERVLGEIEAGQIEIVCCDLTSPSPLAQEILGARPYAFLDDAPAEERRTLAVQSRRYMSTEQAAELGRLDPAAIARVKNEAWPEPRDAEELHDALVLLGFLTESEADSLSPARSRAVVQADFAALARQARASAATLRSGQRIWLSAERLAELELVFPGIATARELARLPTHLAAGTDALRELVRSRLEALGPVTCRRLAEDFSLPEERIGLALLELEQSGSLMRGNYSGLGHEEWCERRLLARIHRYTLKRLRSEIEPVSLAEYQRFLFDWQGVGAERREGREALTAVLAELQGLTAAASIWERELLPARIAAYGPQLIDELCMSGEVIWWRPPVGATASSGAASLVAASPIAIVPRQAFHYWQLLATTLPVEIARARLSSRAERVLDAFERRGALFFLELVQFTGLLRVQVEEALGELVARGLVTADGFNGMRALLAPQKHRPRFGSRRHARGASAAKFDTAGRWALVPAAQAASPSAKREAVEWAAGVLLRRYGVVTRSVLGRESVAPSWRELLDVYRRWEARGEIRGGRFVDALGGEQYALAEAIESLRRTRRKQEQTQWIKISAADPLNLAGVLGGGKRVAAIASHHLVYKNGVAVAARTGVGIEWLLEPSAADRREVNAILHPAALVSARTRPAPRQRELYGPGHEGEPKR